jgi:hypothetical protein
VDFGQVVFEAMCEEGVHFGQVVSHRKTKVIHMCSRGGQHVWRDHSLLLVKPNSIIGVSCCWVGLYSVAHERQCNAKGPFSIWRTCMKNSCS